MAESRIRLAVMFVLLWLALPLCAVAQDNPDDEFFRSDPAYQQGYRGGPRDSTRARLATSGDDYKFVDEQRVLLDTITDSLVVKNPKLAGWLSFALPGAGQVYNGQFWKVPIIYGGIGTMVYVSQFYNTRYKQLKNDEHFILNDGQADHSIHGLTNESDIVRYMTKYRRYRDLCYVGIALVYMMNVFDAVVDAHLYDYDISDDISMRVEPYATGPVMANRGSAFGARLVLRF